MSSATSKAGARNVGIGEFRGCASAARVKVRRPARTLGASADSEPRWPPRTRSSPASRPPRRTTASPRTTSRPSRRCSARSSSTTTPTTASPTSSSRAISSRICIERIYEVATTLIRAGKVATPITLKTFLGDQDLGGVTVSQYLARLAAEATTVINAEDYGRTIYDLAIRRSLISIGEDMVNVAYDAPVDILAARPDRGGRAAALRACRDRPLRRRLPALLGRADDARSTWRRTPSSATASSPASRPGSPTSTA